MLCCKCSVVYITSNGYCHKAKHFQSQPSQGVWLKSISKQQKFSKNLNARGECWSFDLTDTLPSRKNRDPGNWASSASHMNTAIFLQRKERRGEISETEAAWFTGLIWIGSKKSVILRLTQRRVLSTRSEALITRLSTELSINRRWT